MSNTVFTPKPPAPAGRRELALAVVLLAGCLLAANGLYWGGLNLGLALALMIIIGATGLYVLTKTAWRPYAILCLAAAMVMSAALAYSDGGKFWLVIPIAVSDLAGLGSAAYPRQGELRGAFHAWCLPYGYIGPAFHGLLLRQTPQGPERRKLGGVLLGLALAVPALLIILPLLIRADAAFAGLIQAVAPVNSDGIIPLALGFLLFLPAYARVLCLTAENPPSAAKPARSANPTPLNTFLFAVSLVYGVYLLSQLAYLFSAFQGILPQGYTPAEYARRGFFEMAALCAINLGLAAVCIRLAGQPIRRLTKGLCLFILGFSLVLVACAGAKMGMYVAAYGLTRLRVLTALFMLCTAAALACAGVRLLRPGFRYLRIIVLAAVAVSCLAGWMDVDAQVANYNVSAYLSGRLETVDVAYLAALSDGAVPHLCRLIDCPDPEVQQETRQALAEKIAGRFTLAGLTATPQATTLWTWNYAQARATVQLQALVAQLQPELSTLTSQ